MQVKYMVQYIRCMERGLSVSCDWFEKFKKTNLSLEDKPRTGRPKKFADEELESLIAR